MIHRTALGTTSMGVLRRLSTHMLPRTSNDRGRVNMAKYEFKVPLGQDPFERGYNHLKPSTHLTLAVNFLSRLKDLQVREFTLQGNCVTYVMENKQLSMPITPHMANLIIKIFSLLSNPQP